MLSPILVFEYKSKLSPFISSEISCASSLSLLLLLLSLVSLTIIFFVDDFNEQREIIEVLKDVILENHHYDKREIKTLWNQSEHLWRNRYSVDDQVAQPEIGWGTIKVMFNL